MHLQNNQSDFLNHDQAYILENNNKSNNFSKKKKKKLKTYIMFYTVSIFPWVKIIISTFDFIMVTYILSILIYSFNS